jgi:thiol-disulfide isomerase/thioredoxin
MKKRIIVLLTVVMATIGFAQKTVNFKAEIDNRNGDVIYIKDKKNQTVKEIKVDDKGVFQSSFEVVDGDYTMFDGVEYAQLYLKQGYDLKVKLDAKKFDETIVFKGKGANENNFLAQIAALNEKVDFEDILASDEDAFTSKVADVQKLFTDLINKSKLDVAFSEKQKKDLQTNLDGLKQYYEKSKANKKLNNTNSPPFDFENYAGGRTKLDDLKGKYVYIDVWATWCGPCRAEIPFLKKAEEKYHGKNIEFVSISVDVPKDYEKWKSFVKEKELGGIQLLADNNWKSDFITAFSINSIPRFILIDPNGKVVDSDAMRPSNPKLLEKLDTLLK